MTHTYSDSGYLQRKLDHYNAWLLDSNRPVGTAYPGFPDDVKLVKARKALAADIAVKAEAKAKAKTAAKPAKVKRARKAGGPTKIDRAVELYKANMKLSKDNMIDVLRTELDMSLAGATTYYYNAKKLA